MTDQQIPYHLVKARKGSRLAQLQAAYADAKAAKEAADQRVRDVTESLKAELYALAPGESRIELAPAGEAPGLRMAYVESWRVDAKRLKAENPVIYASYAVKSGTWQLRATPSTGPGGGQ